MRVVHRQPSPPLAPFVASIWYFEGEFEHARERILPTGAMQLLVNLHEDELRYYDPDLRRMPGAALCGAHSHDFGIDTAEQRRIVGANFAPGGAFPFFAAPADETAETHVELEVLWKLDGRLLRERLLEATTPESILRTFDAALRTQIARELTPDPMIGFAVDALDRGVSVGEVKSQLGMSARTFIRRFSQRVGLTPKRFARVRRFERVLTTLDLGGPVDWAAVSADCGYFDQAHLIRDFRAFSGMTPTGYRPRSPVDRTHVPE